MENFVSINQVDPVYMYAYMTFCRCSFFPHKQRSIGRAFERRGFRNARDPAFTVLSLQRFASECLCVYILLYTYCIYTYLHDTTISQIQINKISMRLLPLIGFFPFLQAFRFLHLSVIAISQRILFRSVLHKIR